MQTDINRRTFIRRAGSTSISLVGAAAAVKACMAPKAALAASSEIEALFVRWIAIRDRDTDGLSDQELEAGSLQYRDLQESITAARAGTPREMAIQVYVEMDAGDSDMRDVFFDRLAALALEGRA